MLRFLGGTGAPPEEWLFMRLCQRYGQLPEPGGMLDQPVGLMVIGTELLDFERAYHVYLDCERSKQPVPPEVLRLITRVQAQSLTERAH